MRRSEINELIREATDRFERSGWVLPPNPRWDVTDFGLGDVQQFGLVLVNLAEEPEYCEKLMFARRGMVTPAHRHRLKKEDIICRSGELRIRVWSAAPEVAKDMVKVKRNGETVAVKDGTDLFLQSGERVTLVPGVYHEFAPVSHDCIIGEVGTANDDVNDNFFVNPDVGRYPEIVEDEAPTIRLLSDR